jgi:iron complex transport system substrate-binding protein
MKACAAILALMMCAACAPRVLQGPELPRAPLHPQRIVSLDYCADQFVLKLADRDQIAALSPDATLRFSYMRAEAQGVSQVQPSLENILARKPDLVIRVYGGGPQIVDRLAVSGVPVVQMGAVEGFEGVRANIRQMAQAFGHPDRGDRLIAQMDARLKAASENPTHKRVLYVSQGGVVGGRGTPVDEMIEAAGLKNFEQREGWMGLPLESLAYAQPDFVIGAFFGDAGKPAAIWSAARHPVAQRLMSGPSSIQIDGAATACGGWFVADAVEAMSRAARGSAP